MYFCFVFCTHSHYPRVYFILCAENIRKKTITTIFPHDFINVLIPFLIEFVTSSPCSSCRSVASSFPLLLGGDIEEDAGDHLLLAGVGALGCSLVFAKGGRGLVGSQSRSDDLVSTGGMTRPHPVVLTRIVMLLLLLLWWCPGCRELGLQCGLDQGRFSDHASWENGYTTGCEELLKGRVEGSMVKRPG